MTKAELLAEIRWHSDGGQLSFRSFCRATGIPKRQIVGKYWATWNDAVTDAGLTPRSFLKPPTDENAVLDAVAQLVQATSTSLEFYQATDLGNSPSQ